MINAKDILDKKQKSFNVIEPDALVIDALTMLNSVNLSYLIVMEGNEYKGIFCERDYCRNVILKGRSSRNTPVKHVMTIDLPIIHSSDSIEYCMQIMNLHKTRYLLVYDMEHFLGVVTIHDLLRRIITNKEAVFDHNIVHELISHDEGGKVF